MPPFLVIGLIALAGNLSEDGTNEDVCHFVFTGHE